MTIHHNTSQYITNLSKLILKLRALKVIAKITTSWKYTVMSYLATYMVFPQLNKLGDLNSLFQTNTIGGQHSCIS